jgi:hypothetical protein
MSQFNYDEIYGIDIDQYCAAQGTTLEALIKKTEIDIDLLGEQLGETLKMKLPYEKNHLPDTIFMIIEKKRKHLEHLKNWAAGI